MVFGTKTACVVVIAPGAEVHKGATTMKKILLVALTALFIGSAALASPAEAQCWWNAYGWHCWHPHAWWWRHHRYWHHYAWHGHWRPYAWHS
jgi:hypothetical protein